MATFSQKGRQKVSLPDTVPVFVPSDVGLRIILAATVANLVHDDQSARLVLDLADPVAVLVLQHLVHGDLIIKAIVLRCGVPQTRRKTPTLV